MSETDTDEEQMRLRKRGRPRTRGRASEEMKQAKEDTPEVSEVEVGEAGESEHDDAGEKKVDKNGVLLQGRKYRVSTFTLPLRGDRLFMLAMDPAKVLGYRDSYLFFHRNPQLERVRISEEEKKYLVKERLLVTWFRNRDVAVVTARSVFKCFGSRIVKNGKRYKDDYFESKAREEGNQEMDVDTEEEDSDKEIGRRSLLSKQSLAVESYKTAQPVNSATWMHHAALAVRGFNAQLYERRVEKPVFFDIHTNTRQLPSATQPKKCIFEPIEDDSMLDSTVEFSSSSNTPLRGFGQHLLEKDPAVTVALDHLAPEAKQEVEKIMKEMRSALCREPNIIDSPSSQYPIAITEGQHQTEFPIDFLRFGQSKPRVISPSTMIAAAHAAGTQQYYLNQMYQAVGQNMSGYHDHPSHSVGMQPPVIRQQQQFIQPSFSPSSQVHSPMPPVSYSPSSTPIPFRPMHSAEESPICRATTPKGICHQPVSHHGKRCYHHSLTSKVLSAKPPSVAPTIQTAPICSDCHSVEASEDLLAKQEMPVSDKFTLVKCAKCVQRYHPVCVHLTTSRQVAAVESYPWSCPDCKVCCVCKSAGDESTLMICDGCDRGWHTGCCDPKINHVPEGSWLCKLCADCHSCGEQGQDPDQTQYSYATAPPSDLYDKAAYLATYCTKCYDHFEQSRFCPVCLKTFSEGDENDEEDNEMVACDSCDHWVHTKCDEILTPEKYQSLCDDEEAKYTCPLCAGKVKPIVNTEAAANALKGLSAPCGSCVGLLGGKVKTRGVVAYKDIKVGVPEIKGAGVAEMPSS
ncbi:chromatin remodelling complex Rsc7/Swp82 subunit-domain-containing protein [Phycomyces nitens]|nr:chromatin remodelling complex Rsc7/Swp82 subunit-domain-containing protein [Phycomyces nitens]